MPYNDTDTAQALIGTAGASLTEEILNVAQAIIHKWSQLRWTDTAVVDRFSGRNNKIVFLNYPITTWNYLKEIDQQNSSENELDRYNDYDVDEKTGKLDISGGNYKAFFPETEMSSPMGRFINGNNNYEVSYIYGYDSTNNNYPIVQYVEAAIALEIKKNPLLLQTLNLTGGTTLNFGNDGIYKLLLMIPRGKGVGRKY